jgi:hypothetical protein
VLDTEVIMRHTARLLEHGVGTGFGPQVPAGEVQLRGEGQQVRAARVGKAAHGHEGNSGR